MRCVLAEQLLGGVGLYFGATFVSDVVHHGLHRAARSRSPLLARIGGLHLVHHRFLGPDLRIHPEHRRQNLLFHRVPEFGTQVLATLAGALVLPRLLVLAVVAFETVLAVVATLRGGLDSHHSDCPVRRWSHAGVLVGPLYHGMHHVFPESYVGSTTRLFDFLFATGCQIRGRRFAVTGASGAFGAPMVRRLEAHGGTVTPLKYARDYGFGDYARIEPALAETDVLVLCHGSKVRDAMQANCDSFVALIEAFRRVRARAWPPPEVWAIGSEIEAHPAWGDPDLTVYMESKRAFARHARRFARDGTMLYRHIVPSAYDSPMGKGFMSGETAAAVALFFIRRGFRYVPVTYTGIALVNWLRFL